MALQLSYTDPTDGSAQIAASYWRIVGLHIDANAQTVRITFNVFRSASAATSGAAPVTTVDYVFGALSSPSFAQLVVAPCAAGIVAGLYSLAHSLPQFAGAVDV